MPSKFLNIVAAAALGAWLSPAAAWAQAAPAADAPVVAIVGPASPDSDTDQRMMTPPPVSGEDYPVVFKSEEQSNFLRGGVTFNYAHSDNILGGIGAVPISDNSYSIWPTIGLDETTGRTKLSFTYAPGFTFYQKISGLDEADQNLSASYEYRLSPHVTMRLRDTFQKSSNAFNQPGDGLSTPVSGSLTGSSNFIYSPVADRLTNTGNGGMSYQYGANAMIGFDATFTNLHYPNPGQVLGELFDSSAQAVSVFDTLRFARRHYLGLTYQYQRLLAYPGTGTTETQTHAGMVFYTWLATSRLSLSAFGGPQFSSTDQPGLPASSMISPAAGGSVSWQASGTALAASFAHTITGGGGLVGASRADAATLILRQQLVKHWTASVSGGYINNQLIAVTDLPDTSGHSITASAGVTHEFNKEFSVQAGYTRLHQIYRDIPIVSQHPDVNREWVTVSYQFLHPIGK